MNNIGQTLISVTFPKLSVSILITHRTNKGTDDSLINVEENLLPLVEIHSPLNTFNCFGSPAPL
jgi:hypothetical protein